MPLDIVDQHVSTKETSGFAYKVLDVSSWPEHKWHNTQMVAEPWFDFNVPIEATTRRIKNQSGQIYYSGFHAFLNEDDAIKHKLIYGLFDKAVVKIIWQNLIYTGKQDNSDVLVFKTIVVPKSYCLCVVDMQVEFNAANNTSNIRVVNEAIRTAISENQPIIFLCYKNMGKILPQISNLVRQYKHWVIEKSEDDGAKELNSIMKSLFLDKLPIRLCGVSYEFCVAKTYRSLVGKYGYSVDIIT